MAGRSALPPPDAIILSGPDFYRPHITHLYGGYKRTKNLYGKATYQKDPDQCGAVEDSFIYWSAVDLRWCVGHQLGASIKEVAPHAVYTVNPVPIYQFTEDADSISPNLYGPWVANLYGTGATYQADHMLRFEPLSLPSEAADPAKGVGGYAHICSRKFIDYEFPPKSTSLEGDPPLLRPSRKPSVSSTVWMPAASVADVSSGPLFAASSEPQRDWLDGVSPHRGGLCPTLAAVCEYPGQIETLFSVSPHLNSFGIYHIWIFDIWQSNWRKITIDEYVPVVRGEQQGIALPWGGGTRHMLWALLLEKALAKLCGSYEALHLSEPGALLMALTGEQQGIRCWVRDGPWWARWRYLPPDRYLPRERKPSDSAPPDTQRRVRGNMVLRCPVEREPGTWYQVDDFFHAAKALHKDNALLLAHRDPGYDGSGDRRPCRLDSNALGIIHGPGYSVLQLVESQEDNIQLVQLRNIWGLSLQWSGAWCDNSKEWEMFPEIRRRHKRQEHEGTGRFWMTWQDFCAVFDRLDVCPMPGSARKASYVARPPPGIRPRSSAVGAGRNQKQASGGGFFFRCCSIERASN